ncbi:hypothetical protein GGR54DRAFT_638406 [Hypoxylon sp. NC1633]|nr:hypothetical protein GGR54DRAFT_638406 [Hypoxylon sp. NC1633]
MAPATISSERLELDGNFQVIKLIADVWADVLNSLILRANLDEPVLERMVRPANCEVQKAKGLALVGDGLVLTVMKRGTAFSYSAILLPWLWSSPVIGLRISNKAGQ